MDLEKADISEEVFKVLYLWKIFKNDFILKSFETTSIYRSAYANELSELLKAAQSSSISCKVSENI